MATSNILKKWLKTYNRALRKFFVDEGFLHASALTFYTLFAIVPIVAIAFVIASKLQLKNFLRTQLKHDFPGQEKAIDAIYSYAQAVVDHTQGGLLAIAGIAVLLYSIYRMLTHIERSFNDLWKVKAHRNIAHRITHYIILVSLGPLAFLCSSALKLYISQHLLEYSVFLAYGSICLSLVVMIILFTWIYLYVPNTKIKFRNALYGGVHAAVFYLILQSILVKSQILFSNYGVIYGSLAALPIFLIWIQLSWEIVLFGAQLSYVCQRK